MWRTALGRIDFGSLFQVVMGAFGFVLGAAFGLILAVILAVVIGWGWWTLVAFAVPPVIAGSICAGVTR